ncbi:alpha/beta hydrolase family protein [Kribbella solani]|uniref:Putative dienelactone hydrolase n=1 Tax=Kribbella solani TaxID=236067 RepID=A0A841DSQ6_9ACTN|nr:hypothetical protein [Kribbella solani]MBB5978398.1 putative dienelactone hydrolase [Kribbella solani]
MSGRTFRPSRRTVLTAAGAAGLMCATEGVAVAGGDGTERALSIGRSSRVQLTLPRPDGRLPVGTMSLQLIDHSRPDPWTSPARRELMVSLWYPAQHTRGFRRAAWLPPAATALYRQQVSAGLHTSLDAVDFPVTHAYENAPARAGLRGYPVVLFSPAYRTPRALGTALVEDLASRGFVVVTVDHTHEASMVEFPGGRLELSRQPASPTEQDISTALDVRRRDVRFVLRELARLASGGNPDAENRRLPPGLRSSLDLSRVGVFGHSLGGDTAAEAMAQNPWIAAGANLDGSFSGTVAATGLDRPFLLMSNAGHGRDNDPSWALFWSHLRGWRLNLRLRESGHQTFTDQSPLVQQLEAALPIPPQVVAALTEAVGTIDADRAVAAERAYLGAFFDLHLRHRDHHLLSQPSRRYPEIEFIP